MKVSELIELLSSYDQDLPVFTNGYEGGFYEVEQDLVRLVLTVYAPYESKDVEEYMGPHVEVRPDVDGATEGLLIDRPYWRQSFYDPNAQPSGWGAGKLPQRRVESKGAAPEA